jgi:TRAP-type C4-dicarboxylate transport system permease large subunit
MDELLRWSFFMAGLIPGLFIGMGLALAIVGVARR